VNEIASVAGTGAAPAVCPWSSSSWSEMAERLGDFGGLEEREELDELGGVIRRRVLGIELSYD